MNQRERQQFILQKTEKSGHVKVNEIVAKFGVSAMTARRDITKLEKSGFIIRTHGGAIHDDGLTNLFSFTRRMDRAREIKTEISKKAAEFVEDYDTLFIDCGTTLFRMCHFISQRKNVTVITNSIAVASELIKYPEIQGILIGGEIIPERRAVFGSTAFQQISEFHLKKAFIGTEGISLKHGLTAYNNHESSITKSAAKYADLVFLLCDSTKFEHDSFYKFLSVDELDYLITDKYLDNQLAKQYHKAKINLILA